MSIALFITRLIIGLGLAAHGAQKLFGWFGHDPRDTATFMESLGLRPATIFAYLAGFGEFVGGGLTALGFLGGLGPALMIAVMLVAILTVHLDKGFFAEKHGWELPALYLAGAIGVCFTGFGRYSLDVALHSTLLAPYGIKVWLVLGAVAASLIISGIRWAQPTLRKTVSE